MNRQTKAQERAEVLYDLLAMGDMTWDQVAQVTEWSRTQFNGAVQALRDILSANGDVISVVCDPTGQREPWIYSLKAGHNIIAQGDDIENHSRWLANRVMDAERRLMTISNVLSVASVELDGRTRGGRVARILNLHITRAQEEIALMDDELLLD